MDALFCVVFAKLFLCVTKKLQQSLNTSLFPGKTMKLTVTIFNHFVSHIIGNKEYKHGNMSIIWPALLFSLFPCLILLMDIIYINQFQFTAWLNGNPCEIPLDVTSRYMVTYILVVANRRWNPLLAFRATVGSIQVDLPQTFTSITDRRNHRNFNASTQRCMRLTNNTFHQRRMEQMHQNYSMRVFPFQ